MLGLEAGPLTYLAAAGLVIILMLRSTRKAIKDATASAIAGVAAIGLVNLTGFITGVSLPFNPFSLGVCALLGAPGVISLLVMKLFWI